jgi:hypothetical protein
MIFLETGPARFFFLARPGETPPEEPFASFTFLSGRIFKVPDTHQQK